MPQQQCAQQFQLKLGIIHHSSLKTTQLIQFLQNEVNQFLQQDLTQYIKSQEKFINVMQSFTIDKHQAIDQYSFEQYVGLLLLYSSGSQPSFQHFLSSINQILSLNLSDLFIIVIEIDNSDKQTNIIGNQGEVYCKKNQLQFNKLTLYNSEELVTAINRNLYELVENYYYPNEEDEGKMDESVPYNQQQQQQQHNHVASNNNLKHKSILLSDQKDSTSSLHDSINQQQQQYILTYPSHSPYIHAYQSSLSPSKQNLQQLLFHAQELRRSREKQIILEQQQIDESMSNVENVLNNINKRINQKMKSGWFHELNRNIYQKTEKENQSFCKIKLTQEFVDQPIHNKPIKRTHHPNYYIQNITNPSPVIQSQFFDSRYLGSIQGNSILSLNTNNNQRNALNFNLIKQSFKSSLLKIVLFLSKQTLIQVQIYEHSTFEEIALNALRRLNIRETDKNVKLMMQSLKKRIEGFYKQLYRAIKNNEQKKIQERSFLKTKLDTQTTVLLQGN